MNDTLKAAFHLLKPITHSDGKHSCSISFQSAYRGQIEFQLGWKTFQGVLKFDSPEELIEKVNELLSMKEEYT